MAGVGKTFSGGETVKLTPRELQAVADALPEHGLAVVVGTSQGTVARFWSQQRPTLSFLCVDNYRDGEPVDNVAAWMKNRTANMQLFVGTLGDLARIAGFHKAAVVVIAPNSGGCARLLAHAFGLVQPGGMICCGGYEEGNPATDGIAREVNEFCAERKLQVHHVTERMAFIPCEI